jgi:autotransporter-associated beta strand protein
VRKHGCLRRDDCEPALFGNSEWNRTDTQQSWNVDSNWSNPSVYPNGPGAEAIINTNLPSAVTINLRQDINVGNMLIGDADGTAAFTIGNATGESFHLTFASGSALPAVLSTANVGTTGVTFNTTVNLASNLSIQLGSQPVTWSSTAGAFVTTDYTTTITGGVAGTRAMNINTGTLRGSGTFVHSSVGEVAVAGAQNDFTGTIVVNRGGGGSNSGSLTIHFGSVLNAAEIIVNGYLSGGVTQNGGTLRSGQGTAQATNPGSRWTNNTITLNGGTANNAGQPAAAGSAFENQWVEENVNTFKFNSAYSALMVGAPTTTAGTRINVTNLVRGAGATAFMRSSSWATTTNGSSRLMVTNAPSDWLIGGLGDTDTNWKIIPWMAAGGGAASSPDTFITYTTEGIKALSVSGASNYSTSLTAAPTNNVNVGTLTLANDATVNSLRFSNSGMQMLATSGGLGRTLTITSGALLFSTGGGGIGAGTDGNGTLHFGNEAIIYVRDNNTNTIAARIVGSNGLTKSATGTLVLTGDNSGLGGNTHVSGGTLRVGDGVTASTLGSSWKVRVHNGATLRLSNSNAIADGADILLDKYGLFNGKLVLDNGVEETISALFLNGVAVPIGTYNLSNVSILGDYVTLGTGSNLTVTAVPEPTMLSVMAVGTLGLLRRRRRA